MKTGSELGKYFEYVESACASNTIFTNKTKTLCTGTVRRRYMHVKYCTSSESQTIVDFAIAYIIVPVKSRQGIGRRDFDASGRLPRLCVERP